MSKFREAVESLSKAQKSSSGVSVYSRFVNRPVGRILAAAAYTAGLSANTVTVISAIVTLTALVVLVVAPAAPVTGVGVALLLVLGFALDSADGQVARLTGTGSAAGEWLDHVVDAGKMVAVHSAVLIGLFRWFDAPFGWAWLPLAFQLVAVVMFAGGTLHLLLLRKSDAPRLARPSSARALALLPADYGILALSFVTWGWPPVFLGVYTVLFVLTTAIAVLLLMKWFRTL